MLKCTITLLLSITCLLANAQNIIVPANIYFADQHLVVSESGQRAIQKQVDALLKYPTYFQAKVDRTDTYFPIIERIFRAEGLPDDFKYLTLQESGLVSDAVSTSNAVGFWQFKKEAASDYGMRINQDVDERKHIIESTRSAARYLVKHNNIYYKNWHNTLLSYLLGLSGAKSYAKPDHVNKKEMEVTDRTHPYILTFLAHKVAFSSFVGRNPAPKIMLQEMTASAGKSIHDIALETQTDAGELQKYNKWLSGTSIPYDKSYTVLIPVTNPEAQMVLAANRPAEPATIAQNGPRRQTGKREFRELNNLRVIIARPGDTKDKLAAEAKISPRRFLIYNDMYGFDAIVPGEPYYVEAKHSKADVDFHVVKVGEQIHQISQQYGVKKRSLISFNRMRPNETLKEGRLLYMQRKRPSNVPVEYQKQYPINEPASTPAQPEVLVQEKQPNQRQKTSSPAEKTTPDKPEAENTSMAANLERKLNKWLGVEPKPEKVQEVEMKEESNPEYSASSESTISVNSAPKSASRPADSPVDVAIAQTNEQDNVSEDSLSENIDKQVEIENKAPVLYRKAKTAEPVATAPVKKETSAPTEAVTATAKPLPDTKTTTPARTAEAKPVFREETKTAEFPRQNPGVHVVAKGETLYGISRMYQVTPQDLKNWNKLGEVPLAIGQSLKLTAPAGATTTGPVNNNPVRTTPVAAPAVASSNASGAVSHTVSAGESMYQISRKYGVTIKDIMDWNNKADFNVKPGERLVIKAAAPSRN
jgi:membrane-bound lytic murein transglycosylase D